MRYPPEFTEAAVNEVETYRLENEVKITSCELLKRHSALIIVAFARAAVKSRMAMSRIDPAARRFVADFLVDVQNRKQECRKVVSVNGWLIRNGPERRSAYVTLADCEAEIVASGYHDLLIAYGKLPIENKDPAFKRGAESILIDDRGAPSVLNSPETVDITATNFSRSPDYRTVCGHSLTSMQASVIRLLHVALLEGSPEIGRDYILDQIKCGQVRLVDVFRGNKAAYKALIHAGRRKGTFRLNIH